MRIIARRILREFWEANPETEQMLRGWEKTVKLAEWKTALEVRETYPSADAVGNRRIVFNIMHNRFRLIVAMAYQHQCMYIRFIGTHAEYDNIDAREA